MNDMRRAHTEERQRLDALFDDGRTDGEPPVSEDQRARLLEERGVQASRHEAEMAALEAKAAEALASLEEAFEGEVEASRGRANTASAERQRVAARLEGVEAQIRGLARSGEIWGDMGLARSAATDGIAGCRPTHATCVSSSAAHEARGGAMVVAQTGDGGGAGRHRMADWVTERLEFFFRESADQATRRAISKWRVNAAFLTGLAAGGSAQSSDAQWAQVRAEKVALVRQMDEQLTRATTPPLALEMPPTLGRSALGRGHLQPTDSTHGGHGPHGQLESALNVVQMLGETHPASPVRPAAYADPMAAAAAEGASWEHGWDEERASIAAGIAMQTSALAQSEDALAQAEGRLHVLRTAAGPAPDLVGAHRAVDEAHEARDRAAVALEELYEMQRELQAAAPNGHMAVGMQ